MVLHNLGAFYDARRRKQSESHVGKHGRSWVDGSMREFASCTPFQLLSEKCFSSHPCLIVFEVHSHRIHVIFAYIYYRIKQMIPNVGTHEYSLYSL